MSEQEFYVGYLPRAPKGIARLIRTVIFAVLTAAAALAVGFAVVQRTFAPSVFEFGKERAFEGVVEAKPYPALLVRRPGKTLGQSPYSRYLLAGAGKHGADDQVKEFAGKHVQLRGSLIYRDGQTMIELARGSISVISGEDGAQNQAVSLGVKTLTGEIVDSKCNFGVMNPGEGKVHRDCAVRCLSGGIPPAFVTPDLMGAPAVLLITDSSGHAWEKAALLRHVGQPVRLRGAVSKKGDTFFFAAEPKTLAPLR